MKEVIERPELLAAEVWEYDDEHYARSTMYVDVSGYSPEITNHLSTVSFKIIGGAGAIATEAMVANVKEGDEVSIFPGTKYWYSGQMNMLIHARPALIAGFVTIGDEKLGRAESKFLRKSMRRLKRQITFDQVMKQTAEQIMPSMDEWYAFLGAAEDLLPAGRDRS